MQGLGNVTIIANPVAQNGHGKESAFQAEHFFASHLGRDAVTLLFTEYQFHGKELAAKFGAAADTVIAVGGDGGVHEVVNGLMEIPEGERPLFGVVPVGSGNDYALTLGMAINDEEKAVRELIQNRSVIADLGQCNGEYFTETFSFGLDAAIAEDTMERRQRTGKAGTRLYLEAGLHQLITNLIPYPFEATCYGVAKAGTRHPATSSSASGDKARGSLLGRGSSATPYATSTMHFKDQAYLMAVQVGPTYGGHFRICPQARIDDGLFDICYAFPKLGVLSAIGIFLSAKNGHHTNMKHIEMMRSESLDLILEQETPVQIDGEIIHGREFHISTVPHALRVLTGDDYKQ